MNFLRTRLVEPGDLVNHLVLPKRLPRSEETTLPQIEVTLLEYFSEVAGEFLRSNNLPRTERMFQTWRKLQDGNNPQDMKRTLKGLKEKESVCLYVRAQNCVIYFTKLDENHMRIITFRASLPNENVTGTCGSLMVTFPETVDIVPISSLLLSQTFSAQLAHLALTTCPVAIPVTKDGDKNRLETEEPANPYMISDFLVGILCPISTEQFGDEGKREKIQFQKKVRDHVNWGEGTMPFRRSGLWTSLKVILQLSLQDELRDKKEARVMYKVIMLQVLKSLALEYEKCKGNAWDVTSQVMAKLARRAKKLLEIKLIGNEHNLRLLISETCFAAWSALDKMHDSVSKQWTSTGKAVAGCPDVTKIQRSNDQWNKDCVHRVDEIIDYVEQDNMSTAVRLEEIDNLTMIDPVLPNAFVTLDILLEGFNNNELQDVHVNEKNIWIYQVEWFVRNKLTTHFPCGDIYKLLTSYFQNAYNLYGISYSDPLYYSRFTITIFQFVRILDEIAVNRHPLLKKYKTGISPSFLQGVLAPDQCDVKLVGELQKYFSTRNAHENAPRAEWLENGFVGPKDFCVKFAQKNEEMKTLKLEIVQQMDKDIAVKLTEIASAKKACEELERKADSYSCSSTLDPNNTNASENVHDAKSCARCNYLKQIEKKRGSLGVYQRPLPSENFQRDAVVFELLIPEEIAVLRDSAVLLLEDVLFCKLFSPNVRVKQRWTDVRLGVECAKTGYQKLCHLGSQRKCRYHGLRKLDITKSTDPYDYILDSDLNCVYHRSDAPVKTPVNPLMFKIDDTAPSDKERYKSLQFGLSEKRTKENEVLAKQQRCHQELKLKEFKAFGSLRCGHHVQVRNLYADMANNILSLEKEPVLQLVMQTLWETGPGKRRRTGFEGVDGKHFAMTFLDLLGTFLEKNDTNWSNPVVLLSLSVVAARILEMSVSLEVKEAAAKMLQKFRAVCEKWCVKLEGLLVKTPDEKNTKLLQDLLLKCSICCVFAFDVSSQEAIRLLFTDPSDITHLLRALSRLQHLVTRENILKVNPPSSFIRNLLRHARLTIPMNLQEHMQDILSSKHRFNVVLHDFVSSKWCEANKVAACDVPLFTHSETRMKVHAYHANYNLPSTSHHSKSDHQVTIDILRGTFLVDGYPPSVLPESIIRNSLYTSYFRTSQFSVQRDRRNSRTFRTSRAYCGHHFEFTEVEERVVIRQPTQGGHWLQLLPRSLLTGTVPDDLVNEYTHWFDSNGKAVHFRRMSSISAEEESNTEDNTDYLLVPVATGASGESEWLLGKYNGTTTNISSYLLSINSPGFEKISSNLERLEESKYMHVLWKKSEGQVSVNLRRFNLSFSLNRDSGLLYCDNYQGYYIPLSKAGGQNLGTLVGLRHGIVLEKAGVGEPSGKKIFVIQHGKVVIKNEGRHQSVEVGSAPPELRNPKYFMFEVDRVLNRLRPGNNKSAWLYLALLHGATSSPFPDPFTGLTGTEMAMWILQSGFPWSCSPYDSECTSTLEQISSLSPRYAYYPEDKKTIQTVELPHGLEENSYAAYDGYAITVQKLFDDSYRVAGLYGDKAEVRGKELNMELYKRSYYRNINFYNKVSHLSSEFTNYLPLPPQCTLSSQMNPAGKDELTILAHNRLRGTLSPNAGPVDTFLMTSEPISSNVRDLLSGENMSIWMNTKLRENWLQLYELAEDNNLAHKLTFILGAILYSGNGSLCQLLNLHNISVSHHQRPSSRASLPPLPKSLLEENCNYNPLDWKFVTRDIGAILEEAATPPDCQSNYESSEDYEDYATARERYNFSLREQSTAAAEYIEKLKVKGFHKITAPQLEHAMNGKELLNFNAEILERVNHKLTNWYSNNNLKQFITKVESTLTKWKRDAMETEAVVEQGGRPQERKLHLTPVSDVIDKWSHFEADGDTEAEVQAKKIYSTGRLHTLLDTSVSLQDQRKRCMELVKSFMEKLEGKVMKNCPANERLNKAGLHVRLAPVTMLRDQICKCKSPNSPRMGGNSFVGALAVTMAHLKRLNRLIQYESDKQRYTVELAREQETQECENWNPSENPEWLLLELELDITIRPVQVQVAKRMMNMPYEKNGVMQLNMGEGKTSVIIPMIVATLSKRTDLLCRVTVLNSIYTTNYNLLAFTIGGFLNKRLYTVPCSRDIDINKYLDEINKVYVECVRLGGVVITLPEYRLSFRLQMYNSFLQGKHEVGQQIYRIESWLRKCARDLVDESDEVFSVKYQLIYTTRKQLQMDGGSMRWTVCQKLLELLPKVARKLYSTHKTKFVEFQPKHAAGQSEQFTHFRILSDECKPAFYELLADAILNARVNMIGFIPTREQKRIIKNFLINEEISEEDHDKLFKIDGISPEKQQVLMLLSGYIRRGILLMALKKRWRVEYGVKQNKPGTNAQLMAVPFRAKDVAAERTEFGHPDMAIILTQLSYYYSGLSDEQLFQCFHVLDTCITAPETVYDSWIKKIPRRKIKCSTIKSYNGINLQDYEQRTLHLFPLLRRHKGVVDFWLENVVFPKQCMQFPFKLTTNAWDLCYDKCVHATTGFSGTNDTSQLLPTQITQQDLEVLSETNANMEKALRREENRWERSLTVGDGCKEILQFMIQDGLRVLIDAGALMLELGNEAIAELWLQLDKKLKAVVYFSTSGEMVIKVRRQAAFRKQAKRERDQPFTLSPFKDRLETCGIYLDDQHTRGTDINLPTNYKACVTVGSGMRRDKLIQSCMRMRKLGKGQSVHFYLSHEVDSKICSQVKSKSKVTVNDIINWTKSNSYQYEQDGLVYWATNARIYAKNLMADDIYEYSPKSASDGKMLAERCEDPDAQELKVMYGTYHEQVLLVDQIPEWFNRKIPDKLEASGPICESMDHSLKETEKNIRVDVATKCEKHIPNKIAYLNVLEEEQEKELEPEQEVEEQKFRPPEETPVKPILHRNVKKCVRTMRGAVVMEGIARLSDIFKETSVHNLIERSGWAEAVDTNTEYFATVDFIKVIDSTNDKQGINYMDNFLRSIRYFVSFNDGVRISILLLSLFEANALIQSLRDGRCSPGTTLHMFSGRWMDGQPIFADDPRLQLPFRGFDKAITLDENVLSPLLIASGNLYFSSMEEQKAFARFLGLRLRPWTEQEEEAFQLRQITNSGFVLPSFPTLREGCRFLKDPTSMVMGILKLHNDLLRDSDHTVAILGSCAYIVADDDEEED